MHRPAPPPARRTGWPRDRHAARSGRRAWPYRRYSRGRAVPDTSYRLRIVKLRVFGLTRSPVVELFPKRAEDLPRADGGCAVIPHAPSRARWTHTPPDTIDKPGGQPALGQEQEQGEHTIASATLSRLVSPARQHAQTERPLTTPSEWPPRRAGRRGRAGSLGVRRSRRAYAGYSTDPEWISDLARAWCVSGVGSAGMRSVAWRARCDCAVRAGQLTILKS